MSKRALILIDIQNDYFADGKWSLHGMDTATANAARVPVSYTHLTLPTKA